MMVMTAKVDLKKIMLALAAVAALIVALILLLGDGKDATQTAALSSNDGRVAFLKSFGWEVTTSPRESGQVKIPSEESEAFRRYNALQKSQGYDLSKFAGKNVMRYVYQINNFPGATDPVYATVLVYKKEIIGGDVTQSGAKGKIQGFKLPESTLPSVTTTPVPSTASTETTG